MTTRKHNEFLDIVDSDDENENDRGYDSEAAEEEKGRSRAMKRRRTQTQEEDLSADEDEDGDEDEDDEVHSNKSDQEDQSKHDQDHYHDFEQEDTTSNPPSQSDTKPSPKTKSQSIPKDTSKEKSKKNKTGVIYLSSVPPYLKPSALKTLLETRGFAPITKIFLSPAVRSPSAPRRRSNKRKLYTDGWVEFASKKTAKICAETLNASIVGGRKGGWYHDDVWNMRYLRGFKWGDLMEQVSRERREREAVRRVEDARARKEEKVFVEGVERGKVLEGMERKNRERGRESKERKGDVRRLFKQNEVRLGRDRIGDEKAVDEDAQRVLSKIF